MPALIRQLKRGNVIAFTASFIDPSGNQTAPSAAALIVDYLGTPSSATDSGRASTTITMTEQSSGEWFGEWDSSAARPGVVYWSVKSSGPHAAEDGSFNLIANPANLVT